MGKIKEPKKQYDEIVERNRKEKEKILRQLELRGL